MWHGGAGQAWREDVTTYYSFEVVARLMAAVDARAAAVAERTRRRAARPHADPRAEPQHLLRRLPRDAGGSARRCAAAVAAAIATRVSENRCTRMCGFAGLLSTAGFTRDELADHARRMIAPIAHRGPDDSGIWVDEQAGIRARIPPPRDPRSVAAGPSADAVAVGPLRHRLQRRGLQLRRAAPRARAARLSCFTGSRTPKSFSPRSSSGAFGRPCSVSSACSRSRCGTRSGAS